MLTRCVFYYYYYYYYYSWLPASSRVVVSRVDRRSSRVKRRSKNCIKAVEYYIRWKRDSGAPFAVAERRKEESTSLIVSSRASLSSSLCSLSAPVGLQNTHTVALLPTSLMTRLPLSLSLSLMMLEAAVATRQTIDTGCGNKEQQTWLT